MDTTDLGNWIEAASLRINDLIEQSNELKAERDALLTKNKQLDIELADALIEAVYRLVTLSMSEPRDPEDDYKCLFMVATLIEEYQMVKEPA